MLSQLSPRAALEKTHARSPALLSELHFRAQQSTDSDSTFQVTSSIKSSLFPCSPIQKRFSSGVILALLTQDQ